MHAEAHRHVLPDVTARFLIASGALLAILCVTALCPAQARQQVTLSTGFVMEADRLELDGANLVLHRGDGQITVERTAVASIVDLPWVASPTREQTPPIHAGESPSVRDLLQRSAKRHGLPEEFVASVAEAESALRTTALSPKGARGVMQLMPATAASLGVNPDEPAENIDGGARLLRELLLRYQDHPDQVRLALAAYNAGAGAVQRHGGVPPYRETTAYVERVLRKYKARRVPDSSAGAVQ